MWRCREPHLCLLSEGYVVRLNVPSSLWKEERQLVRPVVRLSTYLAYQLEFRSLPRLDAVTNRPSRGFLHSAWGPVFLYGDQQSEKVGQKKEEI